MRFQHPKDGDSKNWKVRFAWFPVVIYDSKEDRHYTVWWEHYRECKFYCVKLRPTKIGPVNMGGWDCERTMIEKV